MRKSFRRSKLNPIILLFSLVCAMLHSQASKADQLADVKARGRLIVGVKSDYPPFGYIGSTGELIGFDPDLAKYVANEIFGTEGTVELVPVVPANRIQFLQAGRIDLILATLTKTAERALIIDFTAPYYNYPGAMLVVRDGTPVTSWETARGHTFCAVQGGYYNRKLTEEMGLKLLTFTTLPDVFRATLDNRCEGIVGDQDPLTRKLAEPDFSGKFHVAAEPYEYVPQAGGVRKGEPAFLAAVDAALEKASAEGFLISLERKYQMVPNSYVQKMADESKAKLRLK